MTIQVLTFAQIHFYLQEYLKGCCIPVQDTSLSWSNKCSQSKAKKKKKANLI